MTRTSGSRRDQIRTMLADLKLPGALEAIDGVLSRADGGQVTASEAIHQLLDAQITLRNNRRLRIRCFAADNSLPVVPSLVDVYPVANWFERECFDLFGIVFEGHPDLRRILTDYGFVGHPFRKDFPLIGNVEVRYDAERKRVVYEPVSIDPRVGVPRVVREDSRWQQAATEQPSKD